jgi:phosphatidyl-myo-inositol alpha-mannosyltransferase
MIEARVSAIPQQQLGGANASPPGAHAGALQAAATDAPSPRFRIAVFSYGLPCVGEKRGGIEQVAHDLANALVDRGHSVTVFTYDPRPRDARYDTAPLPFRNLVMSWAGRRLTMGYAGNLLALAPDYSSFDAIVAHGDSLLLPLARKPLVRVMHGSALEEARSATSFGRKLLQGGVYVQELLTAMLQRGTVGVSENTRASNRFVRRVIPDGIDLSLFRPDPAARSARPSILFVGAMGGRKRGAWLLDRFVQDIRPRCPDAELHMVTAAGPLTDGVVYHTGVDRPTLAHLYQQAWAYASPSSYEGFGLPYVEALACGTPVVATPNPGSREVLAEGRYGRLVSDQAFASTVCSLLENESERAALARDGLRRAAEYDIAASAEAYEQLIEELVRRG